MNKQAVDYRTDFCPYQAIVFLKKQERLTDKVKFDIFFRIPVTAGFSK